MLYDGPKGAFGSRRTIVGDRALLSEGLSLLNVTMSRSLSEIERDHVEGDAFDVGDGGPVEVSLRVDEGDLGQVFLQHGGEVFLFANVSCEVEFVGSLVHGELLPDEEEKKDSILPLFNGILIGEDKPVSLKAECLHLSVVEVCIEFAAA